MSQETQAPRVLVALVAAACVVVVVAGLKDAQDIALPVTFSLFLTILAWPMVRALMRLRMPKGVAIGAVMLFIAGVLAGSTAIVGDSLARFTSSIPLYQAPLEQQLEGLNQWLGERGLGRVAELETLVDPGSMFQAVRTMATAIVGVAGNLLLVVITTAILLLEATEMGIKLRVAFAERGGSDWVKVAADNVQRYLALKTVFSLVTGVLLGIWTAAWGLDFPVLWGLIAFVLNFVPAIGSIVAAVPPVALALVQLGPAEALAVSLGYLAVNVTIGNFLEPRVMGRRLGLSPFVVILSLIFWGYVWGPGGMLVGVPLTVIAKLLLETSPQTHWIAVLLGDADDARATRQALAQAALENELAIPPDPEAEAPTSAQAAVAPVDDPGVDPLVDGPTLTGHEEPGKGGEAA